MSLPKKTLDGGAQRLALLPGRLSSVNPLAERARLQPGKLGLDDIVDALAWLATAQRVARGEARVFPSGEVTTDERGLRMEIVA